MTGRKESQSRGERTHNHGEKGLAMTEQKEARNDEEKGARNDWELGRAMTKRMDSQSRGERTHNDWELGRAMTRRVVLYNAPPLEMH